MAASSDFLSSVTDQLGDLPDEPTEPSYASTPDFLSSVVDPAAETQPLQPADPLFRARTEDALATQPDSFAKARAIAKRRGLPEALVADNLQRFEALDKAEGIDAIGDVAPALRTQMEDPTFAKLAHDDVENLTMLERAVRALPAGLFRLSEGIYGAGESVGLLLQTATRPLAKAGLVPDIGGAVAEGFGAIRENQSAMADYVAGDRSGAGPIEQAVYGGIESIGQNVAGTLAAYFTGNPALALGPMVTSVGGKSFAESVEAGAPVPTAFVKAASDATVEYVFERTPLLTLLDNLGGGAGFLKTIGVNLGQELVGEEATTVFQDLNAWAVDNPDKPFQAYLDERPMAALTTAVSTVVGAGGQTAATYGLAKASEKVAERMDKRRREADAAVQHAESMQRVTEIASQSALLARDPEMMQQYLESVAGDSENVYLDAAVLMQSAQSSPELAATLAAMPSVAEQIDIEGPSNGLLRVPIAEYVTATSSNGTAELLAPHLRATPEAPTAAEADVFFQQEAEQTRAEAERVLNEQARNETFISEAQQVEDTMVEQLRAAGRFTDDVNSTYATLVRDLYVTQAARLGVTPAQLYEQFPLKVVAERLVGPGLDQKIYFRGTNNSGEKIVGGIAEGYLFAASTEKVARSYAGSDGSVERIRAKPGAKILTEGTAEFAAVTGRRRGKIINNFRKGENLKTAGDEVVALAKQAGYDAFEFTSMEDLGIAIINEAAFDRNITDDAEVFNQLDYFKEPNFYERRTDAGVQRVPKPNASNEDILFATDPTDAEVAELNAEAEALDPAIGAELRVLKDNATNKVYMWPAVAATHADFMTANGIDPANADHGVASNGVVNWTYSPSSESGQPAVESEPMSRFVLPEVLAQSQRVTDTPEFKAWFGDSKVVDENGEPLVVYHGTKNAGFAVFDRGRENTSSNTGARGFYFTNHILGAETYSGTRERALVSDDEDFDSRYDGAPGNYEVFLRMESPLVVDFQEGAWDDAPEDTGFGGQTINEIAEYAEDSGLYDGVIAKNVSDEGGFGQGYGWGDTTYIVFRPEQIKSATGNRGTFDPNDPSILNQNEDSNRGFFNPSTNTIALLRNADLSTFVHELGHFYLEMLDNLAQQPNAPPEMTSDFDKLMSWFGTDAATWRIMDLEAKRPHHEKLARGFEAYLFEGKAPSVEMHGVFQRLAAWMKRVYKSLAELNVELTDEVRGVFDRMIASEAAITEMEQVRQMRPLFEQREDFPGDDAAWDAYQNDARAAHEEGAEQLQSRSLRDMQWAARYRMRALKRVQKEAATKRAAVQQEVEQELGRERVYAAQTFLRTGEVVEGSLVDLSREQKRILTESGLESTKLDLGALKALYGDGPAAIWRYLPTGKNGLAGNNGLDPELAARLWGYESADAMVRDILAAEPFESAVEGATDTRMLQRYGDLANPRAVEDAVNEAVHNAVRTRFIASELRAVEKAVGITRDTTRLLKTLVKDAMRGRRVKDVRPSRFDSAEARAAREAQAARKQGDINATVAALRQRFWHHLSAAEARRVEKEIDRGLKYLRKFNKRNDALTLEHQERIDDLLDRFDLRAGTTERDLQRRESLTAWLNSVEEETGVRPAVDPALENEARSTHYRNLTVEEFRGLVDAVKSIEHIGRRTQKLLASRDKRLLAETAQQFKANADEHAPLVAEQRVEHVRLRDKMLQGIGRFFAGHRKMAALMRELDGFLDNGFAHNAFVRGANDAGANEAVRMTQSTQAIHALFKPLMKRVNVFEMNAPKVVPGAVDKEGRPVSLSYQARLAVALNAGNEVNLQRMRDGQGWSDSTMRAILDSLTKEDMDFVQGVWDHLETYKDDLRELQREIVGVDPEWVEAQPVETKHGTYRGGYYPIRYDASRDPQSKAFEDFEDLSAMMRGARRVQKTPSGFLERRAKGDVAIPVRLDFGVLFSHITAVNHRLAWERWVYDTKRLMRQADVKSAILNHLGAESYNTLNDLVTDIALGRTPTTNHPLERLFEGLSNNASIAVMGWQLATASIQPLGITQSITRLGGAKGGYKWVASGIRDFYNRDWLDNLRGIHEKSAFMRERAQNMNQNIRHIRQRLEKPGAVLAVRDTFFAPMLAMQTAIDGPTWLGAYNKALASKTDGGLELDEDGAVAFADQVVRDAQGSGILSDLAAAQRAGGAWSLFTRFYNYMNTTLQLNVEIFRREKTTAADYAVAIHDFAMTNIIPSILVAALRSALTGGDDDEPFAEDVARELGSFVFGLFVGVRELSGMAQGFDYQGPAGLRVLPSAYRAAGKAIEGDFDRGFWKELLNVAGFALGLPTIQINRTIDGTMALINGDTDRPTAVLFGPPR